MTLLGLHDGVALRFEGGALSAVELGRYGRTFALREELTGADGAPGTPLPYLPLETSLDMSDARYRGLDPYTGRQVEQSLSGGRRAISILQGQALGSGPAETLLARAHMEINLSSPAAWRLAAGEAAEWESDETGAEAYVGPGCTIRVSATSPLAIEDQRRTLCVDLPAGLSTIEMWIEAQPPRPIATAAIVCTATQTREAAIVASAIGSTDHSYIPILDLDLPPSSSADIQQANARLAEVANQIGQLEEQMNSVAQQGAQAAGGLILPGAQSAQQSLQQLTQQREKLLEELEPVQQRLLAYAAWSRRTALVTRLIASLTLGSQQSPRLIVLTPYPIDILAGWATTAEMLMLLPESVAGQVGDWQQAALRDIPADRLELVFWKDSQDLAAQVWNRLHAGSQPAFFAIPDEPAFYPLGLIDALRRGRTLLPRGRAGASVNLEQIQDTFNAGNASDHAVIVEADNSISSLVGALYAHNSGARLYVNPHPNIDEAYRRMQVITEGVQKEQLAALAAIAYRYIGEHRKEFMQSQTADPQIKQVAAGLSILELPATVPTPYSDDAFIQSLSTYLTAQQAGAQQGFRYDDAQWSSDMAALEAQVTAGVSEYVRKSTADASHLTVYSAGLPYSLAAGWEGKAVGLILLDLAAPFTLRAVTHAGVARPALSLMLTIDPGLQGRPAPDAPELVDRTITLSGQTASLGNLALFAGLLPLDAILLHSQGNIDSIILADARNRLVELQAADLGAQVRLTSAPLVIYTAPMAWLSIGATLIEQGAAGFVGALWPVDGSSQDDAVRLLLSGVAGKGQNPADVLRNLPGFDARNSRAYVYLGTAQGWPAPGNDPLAGAAALYGVAAYLASTGRTAMATIVYDRLRLLTGEIAAGNPGLRAEFLLLEADYQARLAARRRERPAQDVLDKLSQNLDVLEKISLDGEQKKALQVAMWERAAVLEMAAENYERADELLTAVRDAHRQAGRTAAETSAAYMLATVQERRQEFAAARQTLLDVQAHLAHTGSAVGLVTVSTSLAFVSLPLAMYPDVLSHLKLAVQASLALGIQVLSETLVQTLAIARMMAQRHAYADLATMARTLAAMVTGDGRLAEADRTAIAGVFTLMQETAEVMQAGLPTEEREAKLGALVEKAQASELANSLGMGAWILSAGSGDTAAQPEQSTETP